MAPLLHRAAIITPSYFRVPSLTYRKRTSISGANTEINVAFTARHDEHCWHWSWRLWFIISSGLRAVAWRRLSSGTDIWQTVYQHTDEYQSPHGI